MLFQLFKKIGFILVWMFIIPINALQAQPASTLCATPPMGWNSWNFFEGKISDSIIRQIADALLANGMKDAGYEYIIIDDLWTNGRDKNNVLIADPVRFPYGIKILADYIHSKGLKLGIYSDAAQHTCGGVSGSYGFEELDAKTFASWGIDYLKYDYCNAPEDVITAFTRYKKMSDALKATGRPIVYAICEWGQRKPWLWAKAAGGHLWRTTWDLRDTWQSNNKDLTGIIEIFNDQDSLAQYAGPGGWNDPDMLMVGLYGKGSSSNAGTNGKGCTKTEYETHFALWCMLAAPLIVNSDIRKISSETLQLLTNKDLIAINQDKLGKQANTIYNKDSVQVLMKNLSGGNLAICIFNKSGTAKNISLNLKKDLDVWKPYKYIQAIFKNKNIKANNNLALKLEGHACEVYIFKN